MNNNLFKLGIYDLNEEIDNLNKAIQNYEKTIVNIKDVIEIYKLRIEQLNLIEKKDKTDE